MEPNEAVDMKPSESVYEGTNAVSDDGPGYGCSYVWSETCI